MNEPNRDAEVSMWREIVHHAVTGHLERFVTRQPNAYKRAVHTASADLLKKSLKIHRSDPRSVLVQPCCSNMSTLTKMKEVRRCLPQTFDALLDFAADLTAMIRWDVDFSPWLKREMMIEEIAHDSW